jgi:uncharacterized protein YjbI with pentapeptide repeats
MIPIARAPVRPRFVSSATGANLPLEDEVRAWLDEGRPGWLRIVGGPGSGKSTALAHLAATFADHPRFKIVDDRGRSAPSQWLARNFVVFAGSELGIPVAVRTLKLATWGRDELIEYLLSTHPKQCASVVARLSADRGGELRGRPELWRIALDEMAHDPSLGNPSSALMAFAHRHVPSLEVRRQIGRACLESQLERGGHGPIFLATHPGGMTEDVVWLLRHAHVRQLVAAESLADQLKARDPNCDLSRPLPRSLVLFAGAQLASHADAFAHLQAAMRSPPQQPMAASLLHAADPSWVPAASLLHAADPSWVPETAPQSDAAFVEFVIQLAKRTAGREEFGLNLTSAFLDAVRWPGISLRLARLDSADLQAADLEGADLTRADLQRADLSGANLRKAILEGSDLGSANLTAADLRGVRATGAAFLMSLLKDAVLADAVLENAKFCGADLSGASFCGAQLKMADFQRAKVLGIDFTSANLTLAVLKDLDLTSCCLKGALLQGADLKKCNLEEMRLGGINLSEALLEGALLTGSRMAGANLSGAIFWDAGLAGIEWPGVCLRDADLRRATFHMGSSRSGLVGSPYVSEGTRTGFYTDDFYEQDYKAPEEIRKANLYGCDLRGAQIEGVDFYLVDLRGARYDRSQEKQLRSTGAILEDRCYP